jgi:hypothetical protein
MDEGLLEDKVEQQRSEPGIRDAEGLARAIRRLAIEAHEILNRPDARIGELIKVRRQFQELLRAARGLSSQPTELDRWFRSAHRTIQARLRSVLGASRRRLASRDAAPMRRRGPRNEPEVVKMAVAAEFRDRLGWRG